MSCLRQTLIFLAAIATVSAGPTMGPAFSTGPSGSKAFIIEASATLVLPKPPTNAKGDKSHGGLVALWTGLGTDVGDVIQNVATVDEFLYPEWNVYAYHSQRGIATQPSQAKGEKVAAGKEIRMTYKYDFDVNIYQQNITLDHVVISTLMTKAGHAIGFGTALECLTGTNCGTVPAHKWTDFYVKLSGPDPNYGKTLAKGKGVTGVLTPSDGNVMWSADAILIPETTFAPAK